MLVLALDISTKTGWAVFEDQKLLEYGLISVPQKFSDFGEYPFSYFKFTQDIASKIFAKTLEIKPDIIVIEETNRGKQRFSQKILEFLHCQILGSLISYKVPVFYISTSTWRKALGIKMSKDGKKNNQKVNKANREGISKKTLGLKGKITVKHLTLDFVNNTYNLNLKMKDNNEADAIALGASYFLKVPFSDGIM